MFKFYEISRQKKRKKRQAKNNIKKTEVKTTKS